MESGGSREGQRGAGAQWAEASGNRGATGMSGLIWRRGTVAPIHQPFLTPPSPAPLLLSLVRGKAHDSAVSKAWVQVTAGPHAVPVQVCGYVLLSLSIT